MIYIRFAHKVQKKLVSLFCVLTICFSATFYTHAYAQYGNSEIQNSTTYIKNELILMFHEGTEYADMINLIKHTTPNAKISDHDDNFMLLTFPKGYDATPYIPRLSSSPIVSSADPNIIITSMGLTKDTYTDAQWPLYNTGEYRSYSNLSSHKVPSTAGVDLNLKHAWSFYNKNHAVKREVIVAILDTGVDIKHPDLSANIWKNKYEIPGDGIDNDGNGYIDDINGWDFYNNDNSVCHYQKDPITKENEANPNDMDDHGTHCAGIIGAVANNNKGIAGVASNIKIKIMPLKIQGGKKGNGTIANAIKAIKYATRMGAKICNLSWGSDVYSSSLLQAMKESSMLFIAAAGNTGTNNNSHPVYPASYELDNLISVTFIDSDGDLTRLSNYGSHTIDIAAPGDDILSTTVGDAYSVMSGSSMAVPHVTGIAAMVYAYSNSLYPSIVKNLILNNITYLPQLEGKVIVPGIPNTLNILYNLPTLIADTTAPDIQCVTTYKNGGIIVHVNAEDYGGSALRVVKYMVGKKNTSAFAKGTSGISVTNNMVLLSKSGTYTFYASDYAGNEVSYVYHVKDDTSAPKLKTTYSISNTYKTRTVTVKVIDTQSGVKTVKYVAGKKTLDSFRSGNQGTTLKGKNNTYFFKAPTSGIYTIYAIDYRGNKSIQYVDIKIIKAKKIKLATSRKTLAVGSTYTIKHSLMPSNSTDKITYTSSNKAIATVTRSGKVTALKTGKAYIAVTTSSGKKATLTVTVK